MTTSLNRIMPGIVSDITGVDTLGIRSAAEAFRGGTIPTPETYIPADTGAVWASDPINGAILVAAVFFFIICIPRLFTLAPYLFGTLLRWKESARITDSVRLSRERNILYHACLLPLCLLSSRYQFYSLHMMEGKEPWVVTLMNLGILLFVLFARFLMVYTVKPRMLTSLWKTSRSIVYNALIVITVVGLVIAGLATLTKMPDETVSNVLFYAFLLVFLVFWYRNFEILSLKGLRFKAFLYLCALELTPAILLVVSSVIF